MSTEHSVTESNIGRGSKTQFSWRTKRNWTWQRFKRVTRMNEKKNKKAATALFSLSSSIFTVALNCTARRKKNKSEKTSTQRRDKMKWKALISEISSQLRSLTTPRQSDPDVNLHRFFSLAPAPAWLTLLLFVYLAKPLQHEDLSTCLLMKSEKVKAVKFFTMSSKFPLRPIKLQID